MTIIEFFYKWAAISSFVYIYCLFMRNYINKFSLRKLFICMKVYI